MLEGTYSIEELKNLNTRNYSLYRHKDGRVVRLPSDPYSLKHYLQKGLVVVKDEIPEEAVLPENKPVKARRKYKKRRTK